MEFGHATSWLGLDINKLQTELKGRLQVFGWILKNFSRDQLTLVIHSFFFFKGMRFPCFRMDEIWWSDQDQPNENDPKPDKVLAKKSIIGQEKSYMRMTGVVPVKWIREMVNG